jgi:hypothetical protein
VADPSHLRPGDRADFEAVLQLALSTPDIRSALLADPTGRAAVRMRARALEDADEIAATARNEYRTYLAQHAPARQNPPRRPADSSLWPALAVLTPSVSACSAAVLLVLGYLLQLAHVQGTLPGSLVTAGWILALVAAASTLIALAALLSAAIRGRGGSAQAARREQARLAWQQTLLERGMLPHLRQYIGEDPFPRPTPPTAPSPAAPAADSDGTSPHTDPPEQPSGPIHQRHKPEGDTPSCRST